MKHINEQPFTWQATDADGAVYRYVLKPSYCDITNTWWPAKNEQSNGVIGIESVTPPKDFTLTLRRIA